MMAERKARQDAVIQSDDAVYCRAEIRVLEGTEREKKWVYKLHVSFGSQEWTIFRFEKQINELFGNVSLIAFMSFKNSKKLDWVFGSKPQKPMSKENER